MTKEDNPRTPKGNAVAAIALGVILLIAALRVGATWGVFTQTYDESAHIAAGMEWLVHGTYTGEPQHPPLARIASAVGPYLAGARAPLHLSLPDQGNVILHSGDYTAMLSRARAGILPFFLGSIVVVWFFARRLAGDLAAVIAATLYANLPPVLAHAGLATTDMAVTSGIIATLFVLHQWLDEPSRLRAAGVGIAFAVAITSKFSSILFIGAAGLAFVALFLVSGRRYRFGVAVAHLALALAVCTVAVWSVYRFSFEPLRGANLQYVEQYLGEHKAFRSIVPHLHGLPLPAPPLAGGVAQMLLHNRTGHASYLFGEHKMGGWWYYFPVAIAVKTTILFLFASIGAVFILFRRARRERDWFLLAPLAGTVAIVLVCLPVDINIGVRHVLPIYPLIAVAVGAAAAAVWVSSKRMKVAIAALLVLEMVVSLRAHPDYLPYFNTFAGREPHRILLDSNLDWGQDLKRLSRRSRELGIESLRLSYFGTANLAKHDLPALLPVTYGEPSPGWFAVSEGHIGSTSYPVTFRWLERYQPVERIGKSIRLYYVPGVVTSAERLAPLERMLVPLRLGETHGAGGTRWIGELELLNRGDRSVLVQDGRGNGRRIPAHGTLKWDAPSASPSMFLYVGPSDAPLIAGNVHTFALVKGKKESAVTVPVVGDLTPGKPLKLSLNSDCSGCRRMVRVYDLDGGSSAEVTVASGGIGFTREVMLARSEAPQVEPTSGQFELGQLFPELFAEKDIEILIAANNERHHVWAFVTVTGAEGSALILPK